ncbi:septal ring lytic transglycosylase RlpA family protein [Allochromatium palmeri]|uniref:septal ring lytic transglycosylase RlpA family protein n=1 Tax=Allochromatium palmeri TaxID=231048 RepID=UPI003CCCE181
MRDTALRPFIVTVVLLVLAGCASHGELDDEAIARIPDAVPKIEPLAKSGNPKSYVVFGQRYYTKKSARGHIERGRASWYGRPFHGRQTSSGEVYDMYAMSAAHKTLPLPTYARVTNIENGRSVVVRINDRGPFHEDRVIDLSYTAAVKLGMKRQGTARVEVRAIEPKRRFWGLLPTLSDHSGHNAARRATQASASLQN